MIDLKDWHVYADRFIECDLSALLQIPDAVSNQEIQTYIKYFHGIAILLAEIAAFREQKPASTIFYPMK